MEEVRKLLSAPEWQGLGVIVPVLLSTIGFLATLVARYWSVINAKQNRVSLILLLIYFTGGYLILHSGQSFWILWWFVLLLTAYVVNQLVSYAELFLKGFQDDFRHGLLSQKWEYYGDRRVMRESNFNILQVSNSDAGGISTQCKTWVNYTFSFDTQIIKHNSSWLIRATDVFSYVMLQCKPDQIIPHYRIQGNWMILEPVPLPFFILYNEWFHVDIEVRDIRVVVKITYANKTHVVLNMNLLEPKVLPIIPVVIGSNNETGKIKWSCSYPYGSVGFRQYGDEVAHFKRVRVLKIK